VSRFDISASYRVVIDAAKIGLMVLALAASIAACSTSKDAASSERRAELFAQLEQAKQLDQKLALDTSLGPVAAGDYMLQAEKVDAAIADLKTHWHVPDAEIAEALFVPPKHLSDSERFQLIKRLEQSRKQDEIGWRDYQGGRDPILGEDYIVQSRKATRVIRALESGTSVSWFEIRDAMQVPSGPY
jgi:hypothetical protein